MKDKIKLIIALLLTAIVALSLGWFIGQLILMQMEVGG